MEDILLFWKILIIVASIQGENPLEPLITISLHEKLKKFVI